MNQNAYLQCKNTKKYNQKLKYLTQMKNNSHKWKYFLKYPQVKKYWVWEVVLEGGGSLAFFQNPSLEGGYR